MRVSVRVSVCVRAFDANKPVRANISLTVVTNINNGTRSNRPYGALYRPF